MTMATTTLRHCGMTYVITITDDCVSAEGYGLPAIMIGTIEGGQVQWDDDDDGEIEELADRDPDLYRAVTAAAAELAAGCND